MMENEIRTSIKTVYGMLWDVIALYEKTGCYNKVPEGEGDIWEFMGEKLMQVRKEINTLYTQAAATARRLRESAQGNRRRHD